VHAINATLRLKSPLVNCCNVFPAGPHAAARAAVPGDQVDGHPGARRGDGAWGAAAAAAARQRRRPAPARHQVGAFSSPCKAVILKGISEAVSGLEACMGIEWAPSSLSCSMLDL